MVLLQRKGVRKEKKGKQKGSKTKKERKKASKKERKRERKKERKKESKRLTFLFVQLQHPENPFFDIIPSVSPSNTYTL